jgi:class 3 adenylate cyclase/tetratricopeptide (TPR) repeat protein
MNFDVKELDKLVEEEITSILEQQTEPIFGKIQLQVGERRDAAILFLDLKGFTKLSNELDTEEVLDIIKPIFSIFSKIIKKYQGSVDKYEGDAIMAVFGGKKATENDVENAIRSGLEMQYVLEQLNLKYKPILNNKLSIKMRIGINFGEVVVTKVGIEEYVDETVYGTSVNIAARLEPICPIGSILITKDIKLMIDHIFECKALAKNYIKGIEDPIELWNVEGIKKGYHERWDREDIFKDSPFIGRDKEVQFLNEKIRNLSTQNSIITVKAPAGMGKSRFVHEFISSPKDSTILHGRCASYFPPSLFIIKDILKNYITNNLHQPLNNETIRSSLSELFSQDQLELTLPYIEAILDFDVDQNIQDLEPNKLNNEKKYAFFSLLRKISENAQEKVILVLDDLQWLDELSIEYLQFILDQDFQKPIMILQICREYYDLPFTYSTQSYEILLEPLSAPESTSLIQQALPGLNIKNTNIQSIINASSGTPFYLEEFIRLLLMRDIIRKQEDGYTIDDEEIEIKPPTSLKSMILSRIDYLKPDLKTTIRVASVIGRTFFLKYLDQLSQRIDTMSTDDLIENVKFVEKLKYILERKTTKELEYAFRDALTWETVYNTLLFSNKKLLHRLTAQAYEKTRESERYPAVVANHYFHSDQKNKAIPWFKIALRESEKEYDTYKTLEYIKALEELDQDSDELKYTKIENLLLVGNYEVALTEIQKLSNKSRKQFFEGRVYYAQSDFQKAKVCFKHSYSSYKDEDDIQGMIDSDRFIGSSNIALNHIDKAIENYTSALKLAKENSLFVEIGRLYNNLGICQEKHNELVEAENLYKMAARVDHRDKLLMSDINGNIANIYFKKGAYELAEHYYKAQLKTVRDIPYREGIGKASGNIAVCLLYQGKEDEALKCKIFTRCLHF